jgi:hypothetical protein
MGLPIASASNAVIGCLPRATETRSNRTPTAWRPRRGETGEREPIAKPQRGGLSLQIAQQRPFANEVEAGAGPLADDAGSRLDEIRVALGLVKTGDGTDGELSRADSQITAGGGYLRRGPLAVLNSRIGTPRYTTLTFDAGTLRTPTTKSAVVLDTASAMSVTGASIRIGHLWNHGVSVRFACSWRIVGMPRRAAAMRPKVVAP